MVLNFKLFLGAASEITIDNSEFQKNSNSIIQGKQT